MNRSALLLTVAAIFSVFAGCSVSEDTKQAEAAVQNFHDLLDSGQSGAIYESTGEELKKVSSQQEFVALLDAVHRKLGQTKTSVRNGWNVTHSTSGKFVTLTYQTVYAEGQASEQFVYRMDADRPILVGYHVNSNALILK
jgi:hypothetical protein